MTKKEAKIIIDLIEAKIPKQVQAKTQKETAVLCGKANVLLDLSITMKAYFKVMYNINL